MIPIEETDCIVVAGGNATLNEVVSGLLHRESTNGARNRIPPIGIVPIGETNTFATKWYNMLGVKQTNESEIRLLAGSAMSIIKGETIDADLLEVNCRYDLIKLHEIITNSNRLVLIIVRVTTLTRSLSRPRNRNPVELTVSLSRTKCTRFRMSRVGF